MKKVILLATVMFLLVGCGASLPGQAQATYTPLPTQTSYPAQPTYTPLPTQAPLVVQVLPTEPAKVTTAVVMTKPQPTKGVIQGSPQGNCSEVTDETQPAPWFILRGVSAKVAGNLIFYPPSPPAKNTLGAFSKSWLGEPGVILYGPDTPKATVDATKGSGEYMTIDVNQFVGKDNSGTKVIPVPSKRYLWVAFQEGRINLGNKTFVLREKQDHMWIAILRTTGVNPQAFLDCLVPYHNQEMTFPNGWVVSEGFFKQNALGAYAPGENCDGRGCKELSLFLFDENNDAVSVAIQKGPNQPWTVVYTNWQ